MDDINKAITDFLSAPSSDPRLVPMAEEIMKAVRAAVADNEDIKRYRETRDRMGEPEPYSFAPPNFPYSVHTA